MYTMYIYIYIYICVYMYEYFCTQDFAPSLWASVLMPMQASSITPSLWAFLLTPQLASTARVRPCLVERII